MVAPTTGVLRATDVRDSMGRVTVHTEYEGDGTTVAYSRTVTYNNRSLVTADSTVQRQASLSKILYTTTSYIYDAQNTPGTGAYTFQGE